MSVLWRIGIGLGGVAAVVWGVGELRLAGAASDTATRMTCKELGDKGAEGNAHVLLTDFTLTNDIVYETKRTASSTEAWKKVWVAAVPLDGEYAKAMAAATQAGKPATKVPVPRPVKVIVVSDDAANEEELAALGEKDELDGMVVNLVSSLGGEEKRLLEKSYGDLSKAQIFEVGRRPAKAGLAILGIVGGLALVAAMVATFVRRKRATATPPDSTGS